MLTEQLHGLIGGAARTARLVEAHAGGVLSLPRKNDRPLMALASPLRSEAAKLSFPTFAPLVLVRDLDRMLTPDREILQATYGVTRAEAAIATALHHVADRKKPGARTAAGFLAVLIRDAT